MKPAEKMGKRNMGTDGKTRPTSTQGVASPRTSKERKTKSYIKKPQGIKSREIRRKHGVSSKVPERIAYQ
jgi:hypothetical protein